VIDWRWNMMDHRHCTTMFYCDMDAGLESTVTF